MTRGKSESLIAPQSSILLLLEGLLFTQNFMGCRRVSLWLTRPKSVLFTFPFAVREVRFHPIYILLRRDFAVAAFVTLGDRLIAPLVKFVLFQLMNPHTGGIALVVFVVDWNRLIVGDFRLVVLQRGSSWQVRVSPSAMRSQ